MSLFKYSTQSANSFLACSAGAHTSYNKKSYFVPPFNFRVLELNRLQGLGITVSPEWSHNEER